jgi:hypothetical protein
METRERLERVGHKELPARVVLKDQKAPRVRQEQ